MIKMVSKRIYNGADILGYTSRKFEDYFREELGLKQDHYKYIPQFADALFSGAEGQSETTLAEAIADKLGEMTRRRGAVYA